MASPLIRRFINAACAPVAPLTPVPGMPVAENITPGRPAVAKASNSQPCAFQRTIFLKNKSFLLEGASDVAFSQHHIQQTPTRPRTSSVVCTVDERPRLQLRITIAKSVPAFGCAGVLCPGIGGTCGLGNARYETLFTQSRQANFGGVYKPCRVVSHFDPK